MNKPTKLLQTFFATNKPLLETYINVGILGARCAMLPLQGFLRHLIEVQGLDPNDNTNNKLLKDLNAIFGSLEGANNELPLSWVKQKWQEIGNFWNDDVKETDIDERVVELDADAEEKKLHENTIDLLSREKRKQELEELCGTEQWRKEVMRSRGLMEKEDAMQKLISDKLMEKADAMQKLISDKEFQEVMIALSKVASRIAKQDLDGDSQETRDLKDAIDKMPEIDLTTKEGQQEYRAKVADEEAIVLDRQAKKIQESIVSGRMFEGDIEELAKYGLSKSIIDAWKNKYGDKKVSDGDADFFETARDLERARNNATKRMESGEGSFGRVPSPKSAKLFGEALKNPPDIFGVEQAKNSLYEKLKSATPLTKEESDEAMKPLADMWKSVYEKLPQTKDFGGCFSRSVEPGSKYVSPEQKLIDNKFIKTEALVTKMVERGLCDDDQTAIDRQIDELMPFSDDLFERLERVIDRHEKKESK